MQKRIGELLVEKGLLKEDQIEEILAYSRRTGLKFGEAGVALNILTERRLQEALGEGYRSGYFHLYPRFFPQVTKDLITSETILACATLPLGYKTEWRFLRPDRKLLQLGMVNPSETQARIRAEAEARERAGVRGFHGVIVLSVLPQQLLAVLEVQYGVTQDSLSRLDAGSVAPCLQPFLRKAG
jgi:hypothetical protein